MGKSLSEEIAVLDGLDGLGEDGRIGQSRAAVDQYARQIGPGMLSRTNVIDASYNALHDAITYKLLRSGAKA